MGIKMMTSEFEQLLEECRVLTSYEDVNKRQRQASVDSLLALLRSLGVDIDSPHQAGQALQERRRNRLLRGVEPVLVAWDGRLNPISVSLPRHGRGRVSYEIISEDGLRLASGTAEVESLAPERALRDGDVGEEFVTRRLSIDARLPHGYHRLHLSAGGREFESSIISAPTHSYLQLHPDGVHVCHRWSVFLPLFALRTEHDWGAGDFRSLSELAQWTGQHGGGAVGTLPLLAASLDEPFEPSPYRPISRQFWNELYVDVEAIPDLRTNERARQLVESSAFRGEIGALRRSATVDYRRLMQLKRRALQVLADEFFEERPTRFGAFESFLERQPEVQDYASFRAVLDRQRSDWRTWPASMHGQMSEGDVDPANLRYHQYAQWIAAEQLQSLEDRARTAGSGLYLDLPVGVDPAGYDTWRRPGDYITGATTGAPPDTFFTRGQDWGLPPFHPENIRQDGYQQLRQVLAANMRYARYLRIDHAMGWHRLYAIPQGLIATEGTYIRYEADEIYAVASLESHRHQCTLLAENLGTVPPEVYERLKRHRIGAMWVAPYELEPTRRHGFNRPRELSVASLNTHDMPPAAAWWRGEDIADRQDLGLISDEEAASERNDRLHATQVLNEFLRTTGALPLGEEEGVPVLALLRSIAASDAQLALVNLEDLWQETRPQNVPGTLHERPNWMRKARHSLEEFTRMPEVLDALDQVNALRRRAETPL
jgi:4-alpha-glucanotransferase